MFCVTVNKQESDWGILIESSNLKDIETGKLFRNSIEWLALRFRYTDTHQRAQTLYLTFDAVGQQKECAEQLQQMGFRLGNYRLLSL
jgi:hypothetical protein